MKGLRPQDLPLVARNQRTKLLLLRKAVRRPAMLRLPLKAERKREKRPSKSSL